MSISYRDKIVDRQVGRNAELFALAVGETKNTPEERYPYLRILISILEQARPEWQHSPNKDRQIAHAAFKLSRGLIPFDEISEVVRLRDMERGFLPIPGLDDQEDQEESGEASAEGAQTASDASAAGGDASGEAPAKRAGARVDETAEAASAAVEATAEAQVSGDAPTESADQAVAGEGDQDEAGTKDETSGS